MRGDQTFARKRRERKVVLSVGLLKEGVGRALASERLDDQRLGRGIDLGRRHRGTRDELAHHRIAGRQLVERLGHARIGRMGGDSLKRLVIARKRYRNGLVAVDGCGCEKGKGRFHRYKSSGSTVSRQDGISQIRRGFLARDAADQQVSAQGGGASHHEIR